MEELLRMLVSADTAMVAVTFVVCQLIKRLLPKHEHKGVWSVADHVAWIPFVSAFAIGAALSTALATTPNLTMVEKVRAGLQTGTYSVVIWEIWSNSKVIFQTISGDGK